MFYHASQTAGIKTLKPRISNHDKPLVYFSSKRENTLVYLSNAVEKFCHETGISHDGPYGDPLGPAYETLREVKTCAQIIESASRPIEDLDNRLTLSGFQKWYSTYKNQLP